ncbi:MAG: dihydrofolate reductase [Mycoplasmataceae bacterium]|nr:dihydrofolate reductase [Mycoplasmataceae bacterium]
MIFLIWAQDNNGGIGKNNKLPWRVKGEMQHFINTTRGKIVVMGRKTFESIGKPLPNRENIVISTNVGYQPDGVKVYSNIEQVVKAYKDNDVFVIGGKSIYEAFMPYADELIVSYIDGTYECDTTMNKIDMTKFELIDENNDNSEFSVKYYRRK